LLEAARARVVRPVGGAPIARRLMQSLQLITPAIGLGGVDTLIEQPAALTHRYVDSTSREQHGMDASLLRLSVGVESPTDLLTDLNRALDVARNVCLTAPLAV
jgi:cystathionine beta-lyase/cystathionine gamma-synthase